MFWVRNGDYFIVVHRVPLRDKKAVTVSSTSLLGGCAVVLTFVAASDVPDMGPLHVIACVYASYKQPTPPLQKREREIFGGLAGKRSDDCKSPWVGCN